MILMQRFRMDRIEFDYEKYLPLYGSYDVAVVGGGSGSGRSISGRQKL